MSDDDASQSQQMPEEIGIAPIADEEILFRRIPESQKWYDPTTRNLSPNAFRPQNNDNTGLSLFRSSFKNAQDVGESGRPDKKYFVASLLAGEIRKLGMTIRQDHPDTDPGHVVIVDLTYDSRRSDETDRLMGLLKGLAERFDVQGPFIGAPRA